MSKMAVGQFDSVAPVPGLQLQYISVGPASTIKPFSGLPLVHPTHWERCGLSFTPRSQLHMVTHESSVGSHPAPVGSACSLP
jgi:hypothetical protein